MALSLADATTEVRDTLNESTAVVWSDAQIQKWIKEGVRIFSSKTLMVEDTQNITLVANQLSYSSSDHAWIGNVIEPYAAYYDDQSNNYKGLIKVHPRQIGNLALGTAGPPKYYALHDRKIYVWPLTTAAIVTAGGVITVLFALESDDITVVVDEYQHLPIIYAVAKCKQRDLKFGEAASLLTQFYNEINFERDDKHEREVDSVEKFKIPARGRGPEPGRR
jgi:hypothetical protein